MRRRTILLLTALALLVVGAFIALRAARPIAEPALGFVAKVVCSDVFVGGYTPAQAVDDLPDEPVARLVRTRVDMRNRTVHVSVPLVARRMAVHRAGLGCTLSSTAHAPSVTDANAFPPPRYPADDWTRYAEGGAAVALRSLDSVMTEAFAEPDPERLRRTRAIVIVHDGRIVAERYAAGFGPDTRFTGWSMTKSVMSALAGVLVGEGRLDLNAAALRPEWRGNDDPRRTITLHHLLQMSSGLGFDESYTPTGGATRMLFDSDDVAAVAANSPLLHPPGERFAYSSATTNIISAIIREALGSDVDYLELPRRALFDRIGMRSAVIEPDPSGTLVGSSFMYATARDWARFGQLYLDDGVWQGQRVLPPGWVAYSIAPARAAQRGEYGAHWWLNAGAPEDSTRRLWPRLPRDVYAASGFQGQYVMVVPSERLVVVRLGVTADDRAWDQQEFVARVIRALRAVPAPGVTAAR